MSHELRTPLHGILGYAQLLHLEGGLDSVQDARVDSMLAAGSHLLEMVNKILYLSKIETAAPEVQSSDIDLHSLLRTCLDVVRPSCVAKSLGLTLSIAPDAPQRLQVDGTLLRQVLLNVLGNAVKFTACGGIELRLRGASGSMAGSSTLRFEVADTGPGVPRASRQRLFQDFGRLEHAVTEGIEGAGLGLALSARLAALLGGRLEYEENPGGGSVFCLELPCAGPAIEPLAIPLARAFAETSHESQAAPAAAADETPVYRALHVLVVDDIAMNREIAGSFLRSVGHRVAFAESGAAAVEAAAATDFDVIVMDIRMPGMGGLDATRHIRALAGARGGVPIIAVTAQAFAEQALEYREAGMNGHVIKPFAPDVLVAAVEAAAA
jgi:CheY-like chemotaxis protein